VLRDQIAAVSVGYVSDTLMLDLAYVEDSAARVDMNVVATGQGSLVEVQATAEGEAVTRETMDRLVDLALAGITSLGALQQRTLAQAGVALEELFVAGRFRGLS
jgi:ribonuclease PH